MFFLFFAGLYGHLHKSRRFPESDDLRCRHSSVGANCEQAQGYQSRIGLVMLQMQLQRRPVCKGPAQNRDYAARKSRNTKTAKGYFLFRNRACHVCHVSSEQRTRLQLALLQRSLMGMQSWEAGFVRLGLSVQLKRTTTTFYTFLLTMVSAT